MRFRIVPAKNSEEHVAMIACAVVEAIGDELALHLAGSPDRIPLVYAVFSSLAMREDTQYSYKNALVALDPDDEVAGIIVCYDGARLHELRKAFIDLANKTLGTDFDEATLADETSDDEIYLDSLCVFERYRGQGLGAKLIQAAAKRHKESGKPLGLLVDYDNPRARKLYVKLGFRSVGERPFAGTVMEHMQLLDD
ncbi:MAG: GNAT family N-acetyltransferase [Muribaculaceae bacterium]|nr:GNAT family N-acetyltransferase [Muribaculaceae bacterium]